MSKLLDEDLPTPKNYDKTIIGVLIIALILAIASTTYLGIKLHNQTPIADIQNERLITKTVYKDNFIYPESSAILASSAYRSQTTQKIMDEESAELSNQVYAGYNAKNDIQQSGPQTLMPHSAFYLEQIESLHPHVELEAYVPSAGETNEVVISDKKKTKSTKYHLGLLAFTANNTDYTGHGITTGVEIPISKKWGINTGVAVNFVSRDHHFFPFFEKDVSDELFKSHQELDLKDQSTFYSGLRSFKQIYIPIGLSYNLNKALGFNTGMKFRYTYSEKLDKVLLNTASSKIPVYQDAENVFFNRTNIGLYAGVKYSVTNKVSFALDSEWGLSSIINRNSFEFPSNRTKYDLNLINLSTNITF
ncbi:MAG: outer membrane beta-barrel protein [Saprospiraceae bacterium]|nr:outer membrane beta-barrel protein [Saprospiraceae bacterium]